MDKFNGSEVMERRVYWTGEPTWSDVAPFHLRARQSWSDAAPALLTERRDTALPSLSTLKASTLPANPRTDLRRHPVWRGVVRAVSHAWDDRVLTEQ